MMLSYGYWQRKFGGDPPLSAARSLWTRSRARSLECCRRASVSPTGHPPLFCRFSSIATKLYAWQFQLPGGGAAEARRLNGAGEQRTSSA